MEKKVTWLMVFSLIAALIFGALTYKFRNAAHDSLFEEAYSFDLCEYIDVDVSRMSVMLIPYDEPTISVAYKNDRLLEFEEGDNRLSITESNGFVVSLFAGDESDYSLCLYLPRTAYREISIYTSTGKIMVGRVDAISLTAGTGSGDIICDDAVSRLKLSTVSGNMDVDFEMVAEGGEVRSRKGNVNFTVPHKSSFTLDFDTKTGLFDCDFIQGESIGSYQYVFNGGDNHISAYVEQGILTVKEKEKVTEVNG